MVNKSPVRPVTMTDYTEVSFVFYSSYIIIIIIIIKNHLMTLFFVAVVSCLFG